MANALPTSDMTVAEILEAWPESVEVFQDYKMACIGCVMAPFDTMVDVARTYEVELSTLMEALHGAVQLTERLSGSASSRKNVGSTKSDQ